MQKGCLHAGADLGFLQGRPGVNQYGGGGGGGGGDVNVDKATSPLFGFPPVRGKKKEHGTHMCWIGSVNRYM